MSRQKDLAKNTAILTFGRMCTQGISFLLLPLYTAILDTSEYGTFDLLVTYGTLLLPLVGMQLDQGLFRFILESRDDIKRQKELFSTIVCSELLQIVVYIILLEIVSLFVHIPHKHFLIAYVGVNIIAAFFLQLLRGLGRNKAYAFASFLSATTILVLNVFFLAILHLGLEGLFLSTVVGTGSSVLYMCFTIKPWRLFELASIKKNVLKEVQAYSIPLIPNNLAWWVVNASDRTIISFFLGVALNGIYTVSNKFSNVFITFYNVFNLSWTETVTLHYHDNDRDAFLSDTITKVYKLFSGACLGITALMPFIFPYLVNVKYTDAYYQVILLMYAMLCRVLVGLYSCVYIAMKETKKIAYTSLWAAVINISVNCLLIKQIGLYAASISTLLAFGAMAIIRYMDVNRVIKMRIERNVLLGSLFMAIGLLITYYVNIWWIHLIALVVIAIYAISQNWTMIKALKNLVINFMTSR